MPVEKWKLQRELDKLKNALLPIIVKGDKDLEAKIAGLGTVVGEVDTWDARPTTDGMGKAVTANDTFYLLTKDGTHPAGLYKRKADNSEWNEVPLIDFDEIGLSAILAGAKASADAIAVDPDSADVTALIDDKFTTPKQVGEALNNFKNAITKLYHPLGGDVTLKVVGADADEDTQEFITANQSKVTYDTADLEAQYNTLYNQ